jgi:hypothetical protein
MTNSEFAAALREVADFYETHPKMPQFSGPWIFSSNREEFLLAVKDMADGGRVEKRADRLDKSYPKYYAERKFGELLLSMQIDRSLVCVLVRPAEYSCPDSLLEATNEYLTPQPEAEEMASEAAEAVQG